MTRLGPYAVYLVQRIGASFWFVPVLLLVSAVLLSVATLAADRGAAGAWIADTTWFYEIDAPGARLMLSTIAGSMITVASLVFSLTLIALTLASQQLGPRVIGYYMRDRINQFVLGIFLATFVYALLILGTVTEPPGAAFVPNISMTVALMLAVVCFLLLIYFIHQTALFIQADFMLARIADTLDESIDAVLPDRDAETATPGSDSEPPDDFDADAAAVPAPRSGYVQIVSREDLRDFAETHEVTIRMECHAGHFVVGGAPLAWVRPADRLDDVLAEKICDGVVLGPVRTATQDIEFTLRAIVDIVLRALSPSLNDAHTAMAGIDRLGQALAKVLAHDLPDRVCHTRDGGRVALYLYPTTLDGLFSAALQQVGEALRDQVGVALHMLVTLTTLARLSRNDAQRVVVREHAEHIVRLLYETATDPYDRTQLQARIAAFEDALGGD